VTPSTPSARPDTVIPLVFPLELLEETEAAVRNQTLDPARRPAFERLLREAERALSLSPPSVTQKKHTPPTGDKHDYLSLAIYLWPNPDTTDGLPYVTRDGQVNPEINEYDLPRMHRMQSAVETLTLAWRFTGEPRFARHAANLLRVWFLDPRTRMNPNMLFAQFIPGSGGFRTAFPPRWVPGKDADGLWVAFGGVIEGHRLPILCEVATLLHGAPGWSDEDHRALRDWFAGFLDWLLSHPHGKDEASCPNNHAVWYRVQVAAYALFTGRQDLARAILQRDVPRLIAEQILPDGAMPHEAGRATGLRYVTFNLNAFASLAVLGERVGLDFWTPPRSDAPSIQRALDWALPFFRGKPWIRPGSPRSYDYALPLPLLAVAARRLPHPRYAETMARLPGVPADHGSRLLFPPPPA
jgi:hypothetical protein